MSNRFSSRSVTTGVFRLGLTIAVVLSLLSMISPSPLPMVTPSRVAAAVSIGPSGDAYTSSQQQNNNFGDAPTIRISNLERSWIKFDLFPLLPPGTTAAQVEHATVTLWAETVNSVGSFDARRINSSWNQATIANLNAPSLGPVVISGVNVQSRSYVTFDITALVRDWVANVIPNEGIALVPSPGSGINVRFDSRENTGTSHEPQLQISLDTGGVPSGAMILWDGGDCPAGYTLVTMYNDRFIRASDTAATLGGADTHTHGAGTYSLPSQSFTVTIGPPNTDTRHVDDNSGGTDHLVSGDQHSHTGATITAPAMPVTGTSASASNIPQYVTLKLCRKD